MRELTTLEAARLAARRAELASEDRARSDREDPFDSQVNLRMAHLVALGLDDTPKLRRAVRTGLENREEDLD
jgi:hypothetical protein